MRLHFIGSGDAFGSGGRLNTCFHVTGETSNFLIDCGASSVIGLKRQGVDINAIRTLFITHFHADHFGGVPFFMLESQFFAKRTQPLTIAGPTGLTAWYERVMETGFPGSSRTKPKFELSLIEMEPGDARTIDGVEARPFQAEHGHPGGGGPFFALRLTAEGKTIAYTGDSEWTEGLIDAGRHADLFVAEAYFFDKKVKFHLDLDTLERHLPDIAPKRLVLTHMSDDMLKRIGTLPYETAEDGLVVEF